MFDGATIGLIFSISAFGSLFGAWFWGWVADKFGRKVNAFGFILAGIMVSIFFVAPGDMVIGGTKHAGSTWSDLQLHYCLLQRYGVVTSQNCSQHTYVATARRYSTAVVSSVCGHQWYLSSSKSVPTYKPQCGVHQSYGSLLVFYGYHCQRH